MRLLSVGFGSFSTVSTRIVGWLMSASAHKRRSGPGQKRCVWPNPCDSNSPNWGLESCPYLYRARNQVERFFNRIKQCRLVATRYDRLAANYLAFVQLTSIRLWLRLNESLTLPKLSRNEPSLSPGGGIVSLGLRLRAYGPTTWLAAGNPGRPAEIAVECCNQASGRPKQTEIVDAACLRFLCLFCGPRNSTWMRLFGDDAVMNTVSPAHSKSGI